MNISIEISAGELLDKLTILEIKKDTITDKNRLKEIKKELQIFEQFQDLKKNNMFYFNLLKWINKKIWDFTDTIKEYSNTGEEFAIVANKIFNYNQYRFRLKYMINDKSNIKEQKSYKNNDIYIKVGFNSFYSNLSKINKLSVLYDNIIIDIEDENPFVLLKYIRNIYNTSNFIFKKSVNILHESIESIIVKEFEETDIFEFPTIEYISGGLLGDFIHQLSVCNEMFINSGRKAEIYITNNLEIFSLGVETAYKDLYKCVTSQIYIKSFKIHNDEGFSVNLSKWRKSDLLHKTTWNEIFSKEYNIEWGKNKWITVKDNNKYKDIILLNISLRRYVLFDFTLLYKLNKKIIFIGFNKKEYEDFCIRSDTLFDYIIVNNVQEMCEIISGCYCFIGNLSSPLALAISMHKYSIAILGRGEDFIRVKNLKINNHYYYQSEDSYTKKIDNNI